MVSQWYSSGAVPSAPARQNLFKYKNNSAVKIYRDSRSRATEASGSQKIKKSAAVVGHRSNQMAVLRVPGTPGIFADFSDFDLTVCDRCLEAVGTPTLDVHPANTTPARLHPTRL